MASICTSYISSGMSANASLSNVSPSSPRRIFTSQLDDTVNLRPSSVFLSIAYLKSKIHIYIPLVYTTQDTKIPLVPFP